MSYQDFIGSKAIKAGSHGFSAPAQDMTSALFPYQRDIVGWAIRKGRAAIFADCGMGKTLMQLEWARLVVAHTGGRVLILTPLAVAEQTATEAARFGMAARVSRDGQAGEGITITNYQSLHKFSASDFVGVVLDESSIIKAFTGKIRNQVIDAFARTPYRLACTATPSPNDHTELGNHAEFLGVMSRTEMLATFFVHDGGETQTWRIKGHAEAEFWRWVCSWGLMIRKPSDLGYSNDGFALPALDIIEHEIESGVVPAGRLFADEATTLEDQRKARKLTLVRRCEAVAALANSNAEPWLIWCELNDEGDTITSMIDGAVQVSGSDTDDAKAEAMGGFASGKYRVLVTKPKIAGFGMNWQHCANVAFVGLTHSYEQFYQAVRRCWRYGQRRDVSVHVAVTDIEAGVVRNVKAKEAAMETMQDQMVRFTSDAIKAEITATARESIKYEGVNTVRGKSWTAHHGDCIDVVRGIDTESVDFTVFSPPFSSLYTYSNSPRDMGNCRDDGEFFAHFSFLVGELYRVTRPGRLVSFHCMNLPTSKERDGYIGVRDFRGDLIRAFEQHGWIYHSEVCIWKDPVTAMQRTKALGLLHKTIRTDSSMSRQGIADYLVTMRKPGVNIGKIKHTSDEFPVDLWQRYASPVWMDINPSDTLQRESAREHKDERHIAPLQLEVIRRALLLWSNPGDLVLSPFMGIGSEGYVSVKEGRRFVGAELKASYFKQSVANLTDAEKPSAQLSLFA